MGEGLEQGHSGKIHSRGWLARYLGRTSSEACSWGLDRSMGGWWSDEPCPSPVTFRGRVYGPPPVTLERGTGREMLRVISRGLAWPAGRKARPSLRWGFKGQFGNKEFSWGLMPRLRRWRVYQLSMATVVLVTSSHKSSEDFSDHLFSSCVHRLCCCAAQASPPAGQFEYTQPCSRFTASVYGIC